MRKLAELVAYLIKELNFVAAENISSFHVFENFKPAGYEVSNAKGVICLYDQEYSAVINIERFPCARYPPELVFGLLACWLMKHDPHAYRHKIERSSAGELIPLDNPDVNTVDLDDRTINIELIVPFREPVFALRDDNGAYDFMGSRYRLADSTNPAEQFERHYIIDVNYDNPRWRKTITG